MVSERISLPGVIRASRLVSRGESPSASGFSLDALRGRLVEVVVEEGTPSLSIVSLLIARSQRCGDAAAWIAAGESRFYPPDFAANGVVLESLPVIDASSREQALRATEHLLRAAVFGLLVVDLEIPGHVSPGRLGTLNRLASLHRCIVVFLNRRNRVDDVLGSLISLRIAVALDHRGPNEFIGTIRALKDRVHPDGWVEEVFFRGTDGLY
jgi:hypothetical protein